MMTTIPRVLLTLSFVGQAVCATPPVSADEPSVKRAAAMVVGATVLVRMGCPASKARITKRPVTQEPSLKKQEASAAVEKRLTGSSAKAPSGISVCSGVSLGNGLIVSSLRPAASARFRITLPGGDRIDAQLRVVDDFSSLVMLEIDNRKLPSLSLTDKPTQIGSRILSAAAWGVEMPVVSQGISSGIDRTLAGTTLPPLLQCDLRTAETSRGAAVVDIRGKLAGIVVAGAAHGDRSGWAYAVPVGHVRRLIAAHKPGELVVLKHRRPLLGLVLMQGGRPGIVQVQRVTAGGPAHTAGIRKGDVILRAEGYKIRSAYEAVKLVMRRQGGDEMEFAIRRAGAEQTITVKLGDAIASGGERRSARAGEGHSDANSKFVDPAVNVRRVGNDIQVQRGNQTRVVNGKAELFEKASSRYLKLIARQMEIIQRIHNDLKSRDDRIESLERELRELKKTTAAPP